MFSKPNNKPDNKSHSQDKQDKEVQAFFKTHSSSKSGLANKFAGKTGRGLFEQNQVEENTLTLLEQRLANLHAWFDESLEPASIESAEVTESSETTESSEALESAEVLESSEALESNEASEVGSAEQPKALVYTSRVIDSSTQFDRDICGAVIGRMGPIARMLFSELALSGTTYDG